MRKVLSLLAFFLCTGCEPAKQYDFVLKVVVSGLKTEWPHIVTINGVQQPPESTGTWLFNAGRSSEFDMNKKPRVTLQYLYPCGPKEVRLQEPSNRYLDQDQALKAVEKGEHPYFVVETEKQGMWSREMTLHVDNRERPEAVVKAGAMEIKVPANEAKTLEIPIDERCSNVTELVVDGAIAIPFDQQTYLVDPSGKRCYKKAHRTYVSNPLAENKSMYVPDEYFAARDFHIVGSGVYFLKAPSSVSARVQYPGQDAAVSVGVIEDEDCDWVMKLQRRGRR